VAYTFRSGDDTAEAVMDRQTKMAFTVLGVLILFIVALYFYGSFSGWYEVD
jgi:predicted RND superfamily exporter protein